MSNLAEQIRKALAMFARNDTEPALIGGLDEFRALFKIHRASLDMDELHEYFALFNKTELLHELLG